MFEKLILKFRGKEFIKDEVLSNIQTKEFNLPLVNAKSGNNGVMYYGRECDFDSETMTIDIVSDGAVSTGDVYPQINRTGVLYNAYLIKPKFKASAYNLYFFTSSIKKSIKSKYGYENKAGWEKVKNDYIQLPTKNGEIDFEFMESFVAELEAQRVAELEAQRVAELEAYLKATGLKDYELTEDEKIVLESLDNIEWGEYRIGDLFDVNSYKNRFDANKVTVLENGKYPYVVRMSYNNGQKGYIDENENFLNEGNTLSFGQDTATVFYQEKPYFTGDKIKILRSKNNNFKKENAQIFVSAIAKSFSNFTWGNGSYSVSVIENKLISLPIKNGEIDFNFMEILVSAIQKLVIKDVVLYTDKKIETTKEIISN